MLSIGQVVIMVVGQLALAMRTHWVAVGTNEGKLIELNWIKFSFQTWKAETVFLLAKITCSVSIKTKKSPTSERPNFFWKWDLKFCQILILLWNCKCDRLQQVHWNSLLPLAKHQKSRVHVSVLIISFAVMQWRPSESPFQLERCCTSVFQRAMITPISFAEATFEVFKWHWCYNQLEDCSFTYLHKHTPVSLVTWLGWINTQKVILKCLRIMFERQICFFFTNNNKTWSLKAVRTHWRALNNKRSQIH